MGDSTFSITSINPWRMMLFGVIGVLLPITLYFVTLEFPGVEFKNNYADLISWLIMPILILSMVCGYLGFRFSAYELELSVNENGVSESVDPRLFFLAKRHTFYHWSEIASHSLTEDSKGKIIEITLHNNKKINIGIAYILNGSGNFDAFYSEFLLQLEKFNKRIQNPGSTLIPVQEKPGFYQTGVARIIAYFLLLMMFGLIALFLFSGKTLNAWDWIRLSFSGLMVGLYVWRTLIGKK